MCRPLALFFVLCVASAHCNTLIWHPPNYLPVEGNTLAWIIPPQLQVQPLQGPPTGVKPTTLTGGCGHPPLERRLSREQLELPNEFLVAPSGGAESTPTHRAASRPDPNANRDGALPPTDLRSSLSWPGPHYGGFGLLFVVPESATHLPTEQLIRQQLDLHRTQLPFGISADCLDPTSGCLGTAVTSQPTTAATTFNGEHVGNVQNVQNAQNVENVENVNYASPPLVKNVNSSGRGWSAIGELIAQRDRQSHLHNLLQRHRQLSMQPCTD